MKTGRNEPCHCGSGKKYKKCCMAADETYVAPISTINSEDFPEEEDDTLFDSEPESSPQIWSKNQNSDTPAVKSGIPFPELSVEDDAFLDKWYKQIKKVKKPLDQLKAAQKFMDEYPHLVPAWGFEGEYLLDLNPNCFKSGYGDEMYNFLFSFRNRFPGVYQREFGYYDSDLIYHSLVKGKLNDIPLLLENFELYPDAFPDKLFEFVNILALKGESELLVPFIKKIHKKVIDSNEIFGGYDIISPLMLYIEGKYIGSNISDEQYNQLCTEIRENIEVELDDKYHSIDYWKEQHAIYFSDAGIFSCNLNKTQEKNAAYLTLMKQFQRYFYETITKDWVVAALISFELCDYMNYTIKNKLVKKHNYFVLDEASLEKYITQQLSDFLWLISHKVNSFLTGVWYFADFLVITGNANEEDKVAIRKTCQNLHSKEQEINDSYVESRVFKEFPMW